MAFGHDFALFGVPQRFAQDRAALDARWKELQREVHPDRFAAQGAAAQRVAMQWSVRVNEAYQRLKDPLRRAAYLCELRGAPIDAERNTAMPAQFLMSRWNGARRWRRPDRKPSCDALADRLERTRGRGAGRRSSGCSTAKATPQRRRSRCEP